MRNLIQFLTVEQWAVNYPLFSEIFKNVTIFDTFTDGDKTYSLRFDKTDLFDYMMNHYSQSLIAKSYNAALALSTISQINSMIVQHVSACEYKYKTLIKSLFYRYNPVENYDRYAETANVSKQGTLKSELQRSGTIDNSNTQDGTITTQTTNSVTTFDSATLRTDNQSSTTATPTANFATHNTTTYDNNKETTTDSVVTETTVSFDGSEFDSGRTAEHMTEHIHGNIGITSAMDLLRQERSIADINIIKIFFDDISKFLFLEVY